MGSECLQNVPSDDFNDLNHKYSKVQIPECSFKKKQVIHLSKVMWCNLDYNLELTSPSLERRERASLALFLCHKRSRKQWIVDSVFDRNP